MIRIKNRKIQCYNEAPHDPWCYFTGKTKNPCGCGSNCFHYEDDGTDIYGVCNACGEDIYQVKPEYVEEYRQTGVWIDMREKYSTAGQAGMSAENAAEIIEEMVKDPERRFTPEQKKALNAAVRALKIAGRQE